MKSSLMLVLALILSCGSAKSTTASPQSPESQTCAASQVQAQVIIGERDWYSFKQSEDERIDNIANAVGQLIIPKVFGGVCTGTIINDDTILTNQHCVTYPEQAEGVTFTVRDLNDEKKTYKCDRFIGTNSTLDYTLLKCRTKLGLIHGFNTLSSRKPGLDEDIFVVHENCDYLNDPYCVIDKLISEGSITTVERNRIEHNADTLAGSSGSSIYGRESFELIGLHNGANGSGDMNTAAPSWRIVQDIKAKYNQVILPSESARRPAENIIECI